MSRLRRGLDRVTDQIGEELKDAVAVAVDLRQMRLDTRRQPQPPLWSATPSKLVSVSLDHEGPVLGARLIARCPASMLVKSSRSSISRNMRSAERWILLPRAREAPRRDSAFTRLLSAQQNIVVGEDHRTEDT